MLYQTSHVTRYRYQAPVSQCLSEARLAPRTLPGQVVKSSRLQVDPEPSVCEERLDYFGNRVTAFSVFRPHEELSVTSTCIVEVIAPLVRELPTLSWEQARAWMSGPPDEASLEASEFLFDSPYASAAPALAEYARPSLPPGRPLAEAVRDLTRRIHSEFKYKAKSTTIGTPLLEVLALRRGVCQDFAHIMIGALRSWHLAARYVSGYLRSGQGAEASHAWVSVFLPGYGWLDLDPTNDVIPSDGHVTIAWGRDYGDVTPVRGISLGGGGQLIDVEVRVKPVASVPPC